MSPLDEATIEERRRAKERMLAFSREMAARRNQRRAIRRRQIMHVAIVSAIAAVAIIGLAALVMGLAQIARGQIALVSSNTIVIDGDTIMLEGQHVRLEGIDAPERDQTCTDQHGASYACGWFATGHLIGLVQGKKVECLPQSQDRYRRWVATCSVDGRDLGDAMVRDGWAVDYPRYSHGAYAEAEREAWEAKRGLHQGAFVKPWEWRRGK